MERRPPSTADGAGSSLRKPRLPRSMTNARATALHLRLLAMRRRIAGVAAAGLIATTVISAPLTVCVFSEPAAAQGGHGGGDHGGGGGGGRGGGSEGRGGEGRGGDGPGDGRGGGNGRGGGAGATGSQGPGASQGSQQGSAPAQGQGRPEAPAAPPGARTFGGNPEPAGEPLSVEQERDAIQSGWK